jgi:hypothetical protein
MPGVQGKMPHKGNPSVGMKCAGAVAVMNKVGD